MASGSGSSLGAALLALAADMGGAPRKSSYQAKGWHAQISRLTSTEAGYRAAEYAGLSVTKETLIEWLAEKREPNKENKAKIAAAYDKVGGGQWPGWENSDFHITGKVKTGNDERDRGKDGTNPFLVEGREASASVWAEFQRDWEAGGMTQDEVEDAFIEVVEDAIPPSDAWEFPGSSYTITI